MDVSIVMVSYSTCELTLHAIRSIFGSQTDYRYEVIVVDNHSSDSSVARIREQFPDVVLIENERNVGFASANNQAIGLASGRYVLLLNSDTVMGEDTLAVMVRFMDAHVEVGASGCKVLLPDGSLDQACRRGFPTPSAAFYYMAGLSKMFPAHARFNRYHMGHLDPDEAYPVDCLTGAFLVVRREVITQVGLLDESFFMYGEDIDWCYRIKQAGWHIYYYPQTSILHNKGASSWGKNKHSEDMGAGTQGKIEHSGDEGDSSRDKSVNSRDEGDSSRDKSVNSGDEGDRSWGKSVNSGDEGDRSWGKSVNSGDEGASSWGKSVNIVDKGAGNRGKGKNFRRPLKIVYEFHRAMFLFHRKHYQSRYPWYVNSLVYTAITGKLLIAVAVNAIKRTG